jgi:hypothetical protein
VVLKSQASLVVGRVEQKIATEAARLKATSEGSSRAGDGLHKRHGHGGGDAVKMNVGRSEVR